MCGGLRRRTFPTRWPRVGGATHSVKASSGRASRMGTSTAARSRPSETSRTTIVSRTSGVLMYTSTSLREPADSVIVRRARALPQSTTISPEMLAFAASIETRTGVHRPGLDRPPSPASAVTAAASAVATAAPETRTASSASNERRLTEHLRAGARARRRQWRSTRPPRNRRPPRTRSDSQTSDARSARPDTGTRSGGGRCWRPTPPRRWDWPAGRRSRSALADRR